MPVQKYRLASPVINDYNNNAKQTQPYYRPIENIKIHKNGKTRIENEEIKQIPNSTPMPRWWIVLPCLLFITLPSSSDSLILNDFIVRRYERLYGLSDRRQGERTACREESAATIGYWYLDQYSFGGADYNLVQKDAAQFNVKSSLATLFPSLFSIILLGSNCDTIGRRPLLLLPFIGKTIRYSIMLIVVTRDLSDLWIIVAQSFEALFGSFGIVMLGALAFITDCTDDSERTRPFVITEVLALVARVVPVFIVGLWLKRYRYIVPLSVCLGLSIMGLLYALFVQPESVRSVRNLSIIRQLTRIRLKPIIRCIKVFFIKRPGYNQQHLVLISLVNILLLLMLFGYISILPLFIYGRPFCMDAFHVGLLIATHAIGACILTGLISFFKSLNLDKTYVYPIIGLIGFMGELVIFALAQQFWLLYIGASIGSLFFITMPVLRSKLSRLVEPSEYAIVFIAAAFIEAGGDKAMDVVSNAIYNASLHYWPGLVFFVLALIGIFPLLIMCYLAFSDKKTVAMLTEYMGTKV